jgi:hypothetical protein
MIDVYIDNDVWNLLFERQIDLSAALPRGEFRIYITREGEFEIPPIPAIKAALKAFIEDTIARCGVQTDILFGFGDDRHPFNEQRVGGPDGKSRWATPRELEFIKRQKHRLGAIKKRSRLYKHEADLALAARSFDAVVLSLNTKRGPLKDAHKEGGMIVFLNNFDESRMALSDLIKAEFTRRKPSA